MTLYPVFINNFHANNPQIRNYEVIAINNNPDSILTVTIPDLSDSSYVFNQVKIKVLYVNNTNGAPDGLELVVENDSLFYGPEGRVLTDTLTVGQYCAFQGYVYGAGPNRMIWQENPFSGSFGGGYGLDVSGTSLQVDTTSEDGLVSKSRLSNALDDVSGGANLASITYIESDGSETIALGSNEFSVHKISLSNTDTTTITVTGGVSGGRYILHLRNSSNDYIQFPSNFVFPDSTKADVRQFANDVIIYYHYDGSNYWAQEVVGVSAVWPGDTQNYPSVNYGYLYLSSSAEEDSIRLNWIDPYGATAVYQVERSTDGTSFSSLGTTTDTFFVDGFHSVNTLYYYRVRANFTDTTVYSNRSRKGEFLGYDAPLVGKITGSIDNVYLHQDSTWTIDFWVNIEDENSTQVMKLVDADDSGRFVEILLQSGGLSLKYTASGVDHVGGAYTAGTTPVQYDGEFPFDKMIHCTFTHDGGGDIVSGLNIYFDGKLVEGSTTHSNAAAGNITGAIGTADIMIDDVRMGPIRFFQSELSATAVDSLHNNGTPYYSASDFPKLRASYEYDSDIVTNDTAYTITDGAGSSDLSSVLMDKNANVTLNNDYQNVIFQKTYISIPLGSYVTYDGNFGYYKDNSYIAAVGPPTLITPKVWYDTDRQKTYFSVLDAPGIGGNMTAKVFALDHQAGLLSPFTRVDFQQTQIVDNHPQPGIISFRDTLITWQEDRHNSPIYVSSVPYNVDDFPIITDTLNDGEASHAYPAVKQVGDNLLMITRDNLNHMAVFKSHNATDWAYVGNITNDSIERNYNFIVQSADTTQLQLLIGFRGANGAAVNHDTVTIIKTVDSTGLVWTNVAGTFEKNISTEGVITRQELKDSCLIRIRESGFVYDDSPLVTVGDTDGNNYIFFPDNADLDTLDIYTYNSDSLKYVQKSTLAFPGVTNSTLKGLYAANVGVDTFDLFVTEGRGGRSNIFQYRTYDGFSSVEEVGRIGLTNADYGRMYGPSNSHKTDWVTIIANEFPSLGSEPMDLLPARLFVYHYYKDSISSTPIGALTLPYSDDLVLFHVRDSVIENGNGVSQWTDLSGNGNHSTQGTNANKPVTDGNGDVVFDKTSTYLTMSESLTNADTAFTLFMVVNHSTYSGTPTMTPLIYGTDSMLLAMQIDERSGDYVVLFNTQRNDPYLGIEVDTVNTAESVIYTMSSLESVGDSVFINGQFVNFHNDMLNYFPNGLTEKYLGSTVSPPDLIWDGSLSLVAIYNRKLTAAERETVEQEINDFLFIY
jgi:hypothetical protein